MQIKIVNTDGCATASVINPATEEQAEATTVEAGQEVTITLPEVHDAGGIEVGPVAVTEEPTGEAVPPAPGASE